MSAKAEEVVSAGGPQPEPQAESEASVGVLGWLGFIIINTAAWGIISISSAIFWAIGFGFSLLYCGALIGLAVVLERRGGAKYRQFINLLWVLGCTFVFVSGMFIAVNLVGGLAGDDNGSGNSSPSFPPGSPWDVTGLLPSNASSALQSWASTDMYSDADALTLLTVEDTLYFTGRTSRDRVETLYKTTNGTAIEVLPQLGNARNLAEFQSELFLSATSADGRSGLWRIDAATAQLVFASNDVRKLFVDEDLLYAKSTIECAAEVAGCWRTVYSILRSDGTTSGTEDLRDSSVCTEVCNDSGGGSGSGSSSGPGNAQLWAVLFVALLPMMAVAGYVLAVRKMPGTVLNLYGGVVGVVVVVYVLVDNEANGLFTFMKWFLSVYTSLIWVALVVWSLKVADAEGWLEELKTWAVALNGVSFFVVMHVVLEIPVSQDAIHWVLYFFITCVQLLLSAVVSRTVPLVAGALGLFVLAWKLAFELVELANFSEGEFKMLAVLAIIALEGIGIIVGAIAYAARRELVEDKVKAYLKAGLTCDRKALTQTDVTEAATA